MVLKLEGIDIALSEVRVHSKLMQARSPQWNSLSVNRLVWQSTPMKKTGNSSLRTSFSAQTKAFQSSATHKYESHKKKKWGPCCCHCKSGQWTSGISISQGLAGNAKF